MKKRVLYYSLEPLLEHKNALVITGMRQVGKTTLMQQLFDSVTKPEKLWFDFDNPLDQKIFENTDFNSIYYTLEKRAGTNNKRLFIFIDEIQNLPSITKVIKYLIDHYGIKFIVTGSSSFYLKNLFPESLSGRKFLYELPPLSFGEYMYFQGKLALEQLLKQAKQLQPLELWEYKEREVLYDEYLRFGGFPEVVITQNQDIKKLVLKNIFASFFEKDILMLADYPDIRELRDLILLLVPRTGNLLDITKLSQELSLSRTKIYNYLAFLEAAFFITLLPKFSKSIDRSIAGGKKVYFSDTGILQCVGSVNEGQLFENAVINQLRTYGNISFYNKRNAREIDAIIDKNLACEIKLSATSFDVLKLEKIANKLNLTDFFVISKSFVQHPKIIPAQNLLSPA